MDVSVKVSLQGGHVWEFVCDEGDPMVLGLVSALPGASVDAALPPDGLIQVEARSGERMFLTRPSLVAVTITRLGPGGDTAVGEARPGTTTPAPFTIVPDCFDAETFADLLSAAARAVRSPAGPGIDEIELRLLPELATMGLVTAIAEARGVLGLTTDEEAHLDVKLHAVAAGAHPVLADQAGDILAFVIVLPMEEDGPSATITLHDRIVTADGEAARRGTRVVSLGSNSVLAIAAGTERGPLELGTEGGEVLVVSGSLRKGAAGGRG